MLDLFGIHLFAQKALEPLEERSGAPLLFRIGLQMRMNEPELEAPEKELAHEGWGFPTGFARGFGDCSSLELAHVGFGRLGHMW